ncbi:MAG: carboxypeptidase regulatory-like domain-containing protein [Thermoplasmatota archaeon]
MALSLLVLLSTVTLSPCLSQSSEDERPQYTSYIEGYLRDRSTKEPLKNFTVSFTAPFFYTLNVRSDEKGYFLAYLPEKNFTISVYNRNGDMVYRLNHDLRENSEGYYAISLDPATLLKSQVTGRVFDKDGDPLEDALVELENQENTTRRIRTSTNEEGIYSFNVEPGDYEFSISYHNELLARENISLEAGAIITDLDFNTDATQDKPILTLQEVEDFLRERWVDILVLMVILLIIIVSYIILLTFLNFFKKKKVKFLESDWFIATRRFITRMAVLGIILVLGWQISNMFPSIEEYSWGWMGDLALPAAGIIFTLYLMRLFLLGNTGLWEWFKSRRKGAGKNIPAQFITMFEIIIRYLVVLISIVVIVILILSSLGLRQQIRDSVGTFFSDNAGKLGFLLLLVVVAVLMKKFIDIFFKEIGTRSSRLSPQIATMTHKGITGLLFFVITLIFLFTLLSIGGLGDIGQTLILVISMIVGLVVSFAATGSIGNMLSGLVLMSMKPFDNGDRVMIGETIGFVEKIGIMFTTIKDLEDRYIEIPNNNVLAMNIMNFSRSAKEGGYAVIIDVSLGYDIHPKIARSLMKRAALTSPGVLKEPSPRVIVKELLDNAVFYRLRAYVDNPQNMLFIRSSVMESMLVIFHQEGLEIMSPQQHVKREGQCPSYEELVKRSLVEKENNESAASGLTMFDTLDVKSE